MAIAATVGEEGKALKGQLARFVIVGIGATLIDLLVLNVLIRLFPLQGTVSGREAYLVWKTVSFSTASVYSYFANKYFTFRARESATGREVSKFALVTLVSFSVNVLVPAGLFVAFTRAAFLSPILRANAASLVGTGISLVVNFFGYKLFVFKK